MQCAAAQLPMTLHFRLTTRSTYNTHVHCYDGDICATLLSISLCVEKGTVARNQFCIEDCMCDVTLLFASPLLQCISILLFLARTIRLAHGQDVTSLLSHESGIGAFNSRKSGVQ